jgi:hypothetical protein
MPSMGSSNLKRLLTIKTMVFGMQTGGKRNCHYLEYIYTSYSHLHEMIGRYAFPHKNLTLNNKPTYISFFYNKTWIFLRNHSVATSLWSSNMILRRSLTPQNRNLAIEFLMFFSPPKKHAKRLATVGRVGGAWQYL